MSGYHDCLEGEVTDMTAASAEAKPKPEAEAPERKPKGFFRFKSEMPQEELSALCDTLSGAFEIEISLEEAQAAQARIQAYVESMDGRVGEGVDDLLALWFARRAAALKAIAESKSKGRPKVNSFEIGALFGGSGGTSIMAVEDLKVAHRLVVIDPLDGYYGQPVDPVTGASVDPETLSRNFERAGAQPTDYEIVQGLSEDPEIIARATRLKYMSGYIDGDHTLLGVHNDWFQYSPRIHVGGLCIVDNYNDPTAVEVTHFVDNVVLKELADYWTPVLTLGQTIVLRKDAETPLELHRRLAGSVNLDALKANIRWRDEELNKVTHELTERRKQVQIRNEKIERIQSEVKRVETERDLIAEKTRSEAAKEYAPKLAHLDKTLAERTAELKALRGAHDADKDALETARMKAQRLETELSDQAARLSELQAENKAGADRVKALERQVEDAQRSRDEERAALKEAEVKINRLRDKAGTARSELDQELSSMRTALHERDLELARLSERLEARERELEGARRDEAAAETALEKVRERADALDRQVRDQDGVIRELQFKVQQAAYEAEQHAETRAALEAVRAELEAAREKASALRAEKVETEARLAALQGERDRLSAERDALTEKLSETEGQAKDLSTRLTELDAQNRRLAEEAKREAERAGAAEAALQEQREALSAERDALQDQLSDSEHRAEDLSNRLSQLDEQHRRLAEESKLEAERAEEAEAALQEQREALSAERDALKDQLSESEHRALDLSSQLSQLEARNGQLAAAVENEVLRADQAEAALQSARERLTTVSEDAESARSEVRRLEHLVKTGSGDLSAARAALGAAEERAEALNAELRMRNADLERLRSQAADSEARVRSLDALRAESEARVAQSAADMARARQRITSLVQADDARTAELARIRRERDQAAKARDEAAEKTRKVESDLQGWRQKASRATQEADQTRAEADAAREQAAQLEARLRVLEAQQSAPRILLRRLLKSSAVRTLQILGMQDTAARVRGRKALSSAAPAIRPSLPQIPPTPETHDAGPPQHDLTFFVNYTFGGKTRYLPRTEFLRHTLRSGRAMRALKGAFKGERCFVIGNGPSLNHQNLKQLKNEFTIGANYIYMNEEKMGFTPTLISFANYLVIQQRLDEILGLKDSLRVLPYYLFDDFGAPDETVIINMQHQTPEFSLDASCYASTQSTVTYVNLQLAYYLGFDQVCLIGVDNRYIQPERGKEGTVLTQEEDDPNHFTPAYFKGLKWQKGDEEKMESLYARARIAFEDRGSKVIDCTYNGALTIFDKGDLDTVVRQKPAPALSSVVKAKETFRNITRAPQEFEPETVIVTISPDLADAFGHHLNMDRFLRAQAHAEGQELVSLCSINVEQTLADHNNWLVPAFSVKSWHSRLDASVVARKQRRFEAELLKGLAVVMEAFDPGVRFVLYMYTGNLHLGKVLSDVAAGFDNVEAHIHHFYAAMTDMEDAGVVAESRDLIHDIENRGGELYLGTYDLVSYFKQKTGFKLNYLGDPSVTFDDAEVQAMIDNGSTPRDGLVGPARVFFPPNMNVEKGYRTVLDATEALLASDELTSEFKPILRYVPREHTPEALVRRAEALKDAKGAEVLEGVLSDDDFKSVTLSADIIAITYTVKAFNRRMSGSLTDALMTAKPIVATRGTYVGDQVERFGCGEVFDEGDVDGLIAGLKKIRENYRSYHEAAIAARRKYFKERSWDALHRRLTD
ncbi:MAG: hypothetical protein NXI12_07330 [Alphaproteobacteria bacterium]|nr:hypothetical protein [Alphaproteobacteria bacterium]